MNRRTSLLLLFVTLLAVLLRILPTSKDFAVGNDFGIYYSILQDFLSSGKVFTTYPSPWGSAGYGDFPVMYWSVIGVAKITGLGYTTVLVKLPPIVGGLCTLPIYFIAKKVTGKNSIGVLAALFDATNPVLVFQTSISSILVFGHFFGLITVLLFIYYTYSPRFFFVTLASGMLMVMSHPLSTFMYLMAILGITFVSLAREHTMKRRLLFSGLVYSLSAFTFFYWALFFTRFSDFMSGGILGLPSFLIMMAYFSLVTAIIFFPYSKIIPTILLSGRSSGWSLRRAQTVSLISYFVGTILAVLVLLDSLPSFNPRDAINLVPLMLDGLFAVIGFNVVSGKARTILTGWLLTLTLSLAYSIATWNLVLLPGRYIEYIFEPLSILEAIGVLPILIRARDDIRSGRPRKQMPTHHNGKGNRRDGPKVIGGISLSKRALRRIVPLAMGRGYMRAVAAFLLLAVLVASSAATPYQMGKEVTPSGNQSISTSDHVAAEWLSSNASSNLSVATDHILGLLIDGYNLSGTFESISYAWNESTLSNKSLHELMGNEYSDKYNHSPVGYILIDNYMLSNGVWGYHGLTNPYASSIRLGNRSFLKFFSEPFVPIFFNFTSRNSWSFITQVNWTYIDLHYGTNISTHVRVHRSAQVNTSKVMNLIRYGKKENASKSQY